MVHGRQFNCRVRLIPALVKDFWGRRDGIAALEFALIAPLMIYTLLAFSDIAGALSTTRRMTNASDVVAQLVSQQVEGGKPASGSTPAVPATPTQTISNAMLLEDFYSLVTTLPEVMPDAASRNEVWTADVQVIVSSVQFGPPATCVINPPNAVVCSSATVIWSAGFNNAGTGFPTSIRSCGAITQAVSNQESPGLGIIPPGVYEPGTIVNSATSPGTIIVVDILYTFRPMFTKWLTGPFTFQRTAYLAPRFYTQLGYTPDSNATKSVGATATTYNTTGNTTVSGFVACQYTGG